MKIHVQIRRFTCCLNMGLNLKILKNVPCAICMTLYTEGNANQTDHFANVSVHKNVVCSNDVVATL